MKVPISWLGEYVAIDVPPAALAARLAISSCEVDRIVRRGVPDEDGNLGRFLVGRVLEAAKHPNADRLQLCQVDVGEGAPRQIVCGAWNFGAGATVAVALPGAVLPAGQQLSEVELRGQLSRGMILAEDELELGTDHSGIMLLPDEHEPGTPLADVLPLVEDVLEIETGFNRPDLTSIYGIAREVAALYELDLAEPPGRDPELAEDEEVDVRVDDLAGCPRYIGRLFRDVVVGPSPAWLKARLLAAGMRPISNVVDVTNYVMLALGSPLHAFDRTKLAGGRIVVRRAEPGEDLRTLDGQVRRLEPSDLMIADAERSVAIAGIMGGEETEVSPDTTELLLEAANFEPIGIMRSSERLRLRSEGSGRWEKGVDPYVAEQAAAYATQLFVELAGARWVAHVDIQGELPSRPVVALRTSRADDVLGLTIDPAEQRTRLERLGFEVDEDWQVTVPTWRIRDVAREIDLVEEVGRFRLDDIPATLPRRQLMSGRLTPAQRLRRAVEDVLRGAGFAEAYTWTLVPPEAEPRGVALLEPLTAEQAVLRTELLPSLAEAARRNVELGNEPVALFELARVYLPSGGSLPDERWRLAGITQGGFARAKGAVELVLDALGVETRFLPGAEAREAELLGGAVRELEDGLGAFELDLDELIGHLREVRLYEDVLTYPAVKQDLAFTVDETVTAGDLVEAARDAAGPELREIRVFDVYRGEQTGAGKKSVAFSVAFQSPERTLSDEDAARLRGRIVEALGERFGATLRA
jgi:phenylalanyl-tRNA synthetase beta chain